MFKVPVDLLEIKNDSFEFHSSVLSVITPQVLKASGQSDSFKYNGSVSSSSIFRTRNPVNNSSYFLVYFHLLYFHRCIFYIRNV